ncbi:MAG: hypothetical protein ABFS42_12610 [Candidatus Krumholzibacteriota bacterium]
MSLFRKVLLVCFTAFLWSAPLSGAVLQVTGDGDSKPPSPGFVYTRTPFDCTPFQIVPLTVGTSSSLMDDTTGGPSLIDGYPCAGWDEASPEHIYRLDVSEGDTLQFWAGLSNIDPVIDHDLFLLNGCDTDSCLIGANTEITATLTGGSYYLIVDGYSERGINEGPYTVDYNCRYVGVAPLVCLPGVATPVDFNQPETELVGNLHGLFNAVQEFECSPILLKGGEKWYSLTMPARTGNQFGGADFSEFKVQILELAPSLDIALWLFDGCGTSPTCLDYANSGTGGQAETLTYRNETDQEVTVYLGVDCFRAPTETGSGYFSIKFTTDIIVPAEKTSFGSLRALYR